MFFLKKTDKLSKYFLSFRKLTQIRRDIGFNFGLTTNYFRLKSEILNHLLSKLEIWGFAQFDFSSSNPQEIIILGDIVALEGSKYI